MTRTPEEILKSILAKLEMMGEVALRRSKHISAYSAYEHGRYEALKEAILLVKAEASTK